MSCSLITLNLLKDKGFSVSDVSSFLDVHRQQVYKALKCSPHSSRRVRLHISSLIGRPPSLLFPDLPQNVKIIDDFQFMNSLMSSYQEDSALVKTCKNSVQN